jgi:hypothetical protein
VSPWIVVLVADDRAMNNQNPSTRVRLRVVDPTEYLIQRMVVLAAVGALLALVAVSTLEGHWGTGRGYLDRPADLRDGRGHRKRLA